MLAAALGWRDDAGAAAALAGVSLLFPVRGGGRVHPLHKSVFDWLVDAGRSGALAVGVAAGEARRAPVGPQPAGARAAAVGGRERGGARRAAQEQRRGRRQLGLQGRPIKLS